MPAAKRIPKPAPRSRRYILPRRFVTVRPASASPVTSISAKAILRANATSLGGCESLIEHRASVEGADSKTPDNLLRISVGLEHPDDLIADLDQTLHGLAPV